MITKKDTFDEINHLKTNVSKLESRDILSTFILQTQIFGGHPTGLYILTLLEVAESRSLVDHKQPGRVPDGLTRGLQTGQLQQPAYIQYTIYPGSNLIRKSAMF